MGVAPAEAIAVRLVDVCGGEGPRWLLAYSSGLDKGRRSQIIEMLGGHDR